MAIRQVRVQAKTPVHRWSSAKREFVSRQGIPVAVLETSAPSVTQGRELNTLMVEAPGKAGH